MSYFLVTQLSYIDNSLVQAGSIVEHDSLKGDHLIPCDKNGKPLDKEVKPILLVSNGLGGSTQTAPDGQPLDGKDSDTAKIVGTVAAVKS